MKITFVVQNANLSGGVRVVAIYAERLHQLGHEVSLISRPKAKPKLKQQLRSLLKGKGLIQSTQAASHFDNIDPGIPHHILDKERTLTDLDVPDADVIVATWWKTAEEINRLSASKGKKVYFIQQCETHQGQPVERVKATYQLPFHKITISQWLVDLMAEEYGDSDTSLIFNSVDGKQFYAPKRTKQDVPTVGMLYKPAFHKGCDVALKAVAKATQTFPNLKLILFGACDISGDYPLPEGAEYIKQPEQDKIKDIYARCDVWLCGSRSEGFHLPPLEAMACRCPVVSTRVGGPMDIIENGVNGYLVPVEDDEALANRLVQALSLSPEDWQSMSDAAYALATQNTWTTQAKLFEAALYKAIEEKSLLAVTP